MDKSVQAWCDICQNISPLLSQNLLNAGFSKPTNIQMKTIPLLTNFKDVDVVAIGALIISPTRELAKQTYNVVKSITLNLPLVSQLFVGGVDPEIDKAAFLEKGGNIIIGTPGRLEHLIARKKETEPNYNGILTSNLKKFEVLILDEADKLLDMGFSDTATRTQSITDLAKAGLRNPIMVNLEEIIIENEASKKEAIAVPSSLKSYYEICSYDSKLDNLIRFLKYNQDKKIILFFSTINCVEYFGKIIKKILPNLSITMLHRKLKKGRFQILEKFTELHSGLLICSDLISRGIDIPKVHWVLQYEPPNKINSFIHRIGRTARLGNLGNSLVFLYSSEESYIRFLEINQNVPIRDLKCFDSLYEKPVDSSNFVNLIRSIAQTNREFYLQGIKAFVSYVRFYQQHQCKHLFKIKELDLGSIATSFGLLHLPKMPEIKTKNCQKFKPVHMNYDEIPFSEKEKEKKRLLEIEQKNSKNKKPHSYVPKKDKIRIGKFTHDKMISKKHKFTQKDYDELNTDIMAIRRIKRKHGRLEDMKEILPD